MRFATTLLGVNSVIRTGKKLLRDGNFVNDEVKA